MSEQRIPPASAIVDALAIRGIHGVLSPPLWDVTGLTLTARGRARTVQMVPTDEAGRAFDELYALLDQDLTDAVVVIAGAEPVSAAVWGQILSRAARRSGAVAALIAGAVRDRSELPAEGLAVWAISERTVGATGRARVVDIDVAARIESVTVRPGDEIVLDAGGAVCVPSELTAEVYRDADELCRAEQLLLQDLERGVALQEAYRYKRRATAAIRAAPRESVRDAFGGGPSLMNNDLSADDLSGRIFTGRDLSDADLSGKSLRNAHMARADLSSADLSEADLEGADLTDAKLVGAKLRRANFCWAVLSGADLSGADVDDAMFVGARLDGAILADVDLARADVTGAVL